MEKFSINELKKIKYKAYKTQGKNKVQYINLASGFDIETSSIMVNGDKMAFMYVWTMGIEDHIFQGRTWESFINVLEKITQFYKLTSERRLIVYVHNLGYEFQFMRKYLDFISVFSVDERKPIKAVTSLGIEFRDSYILSGYSLENTAKNLKHPIKKLVGDLDYTLVRHADTPITDKEQGYILNDVLIIIQYIREQLEIYGRITKIPLTNTGRVRKYVKDNCYYNKKSHKKTSLGKYQRYKTLMEKLTLTVEDYNQLKRAFMGGFTHSSSYHTNELIENVHSIDFTSSYPAVMLAEKYPMTRPYKLDIKTLDEFKRASKKYGLIFDVRFTNLQNKIRYESYLSESKCYNLKNKVVVNGRIFSADSLTTTITNIDLEIIDKVYKYDYMEFANVKAFKMGFLPTPIINSIIDLYQNKTELKGVKGKEVEYLLSKGMLNSVYGMSVTDIVRDDIIYNSDLEEWEKSPADPNEQINKYNTKHGRFLYYPWGIWVTAYARRNLWTGIIAMGDDYIYSDTDSIKFTNYNKHKGYISWYNNSLNIKLNIMAKNKDIDIKRLSPKTIEGVEKPIGVWDYDGHYKRFKTLGAKRYLVEYDNGNLELTVAGLSKRNGVEYMKKICNNDNEKVFDMFTNNLYIPANETGKNTHTYLDTEKQANVTDYMGNTRHVISKSAVHLSKTDFTLSISRGFLDFLYNLLNGYVFIGATTWG